MRWQFLLNQCNLANQINIFAIAQAAETQIQPTKGRNTSILIKIVHTSALNLVLPTV